MTLLENLQLALLHLVYLTCNDRVICNGTMVTLYQV